MTLCVLQVLDAVETLRPGYTVEVESARYSPLGSETRDELSKLLVHFEQTKASDVILVGEKGLRLPRVGGSGSHTVTPVVPTFLRLPNG